MYRAATRWPQLPRRWVSPARRARLDFPEARAAANLLPYMRADSASNGKGSQVAVAHCHRSWRRARSSLFSVAVRAGGEFGERHG